MFLLYIMGQLCIMERMSDKYDFSNPDVRNEYVTEMGCSFGCCISTLKNEQSRVAGHLFVMNSNVTPRIAS